MLRGKIKILDSKQKIEDNILKAATPEIKQIFQSAKPRIESGIKNLVVEALSVCPEIASLRGGTLKYDFGLVLDPTVEIIYAVANSVNVYFKNFRITKKAVNNILSIYIQPKDFANLLDNAYANVITEKGEVLPWLEWLLTAGDTIVILDYTVAYGIFPESRSGGAIMVPDGFFRVDPEFSGTREDNFITRALEGYSSRIEEIVRSSI